MPDAMLSPGAQAVAAPDSEPVAERAGSPRERQRGAAITAIGAALPERAVASADIAARLGVDSRWIEQRTGIFERRHASTNESLTALATEASEKALAAAELEAGELDMVLVATLTSDRLLPNTAPLVADALGARGAFACDLGAACTGFLSGLSLASAQIESGRARHALVVGAELLSRVTDHSDRKTAGLFADGAGAAVLSATEDGRGIGSVVLHSDATESECLVIDNAERLIKMRGQDTFRAAVEALSGVTLEVLETEGIGIDDVDLFVYHQANARITAAVGERLALPREKVVDCIARLGNTSAATLPLALDHALSERRLREGDRVLLAAFGAGFVWGGGLLTWTGGAER